MYLSQTLWDYSKTQYLTDVSIRCLDGVVYAHKAVMANYCPNIFFNFPILREQESITIILHQSSHLEAREALQMLYLEGIGGGFEAILGISAGKLANSLKVELVEDETNGDIMDSLDYPDAKDDQDDFHDDHKDDQDDFHDDHKEEQDVGMEDKKNTKPLKKRLIVPKPNYTIGDYPCYNCDANLGNEMDLSIHRIPIPCIFCPIKSPCVVKWKQHLKEDHPRPRKDESGSRKFTCPSCSFAGMKNKVIYHFETSHGGKLYTCFGDDCGKSYATREALVRHVEKTHVDNAEKRDIFQSVQCEHCSKVLINKAIYLRHIKLQHSGETVTFECSWCGKTFKNKDYCKDHENRMHLETAKITCDICGMKVSKLEDHMIRRHPENVDPEKLIDFQCQHCEFQTKIRGSLQKHIQRLHQEKNIHCEKCPFKTSMKSFLTHHMKRAHGDCEFPCEFDGCDRTFSLESEMKHHVKQTHPDGVFHCAECGKQFLNQLKLTRHMKYHNLDTDGWPCTVCPQRFISKQKLGEHMNVHTGETPFRCRGDACQKAFSTSSALSHHEKGCLANGNVRKYCKI